MLKAWHLWTGTTMDVETTSVRTGAGVRLGSDLRGGGGRLEDVRVEERARRRVVGQLGRWHRHVRLVGPGGCRQVRVVRCAGVVRGVLAPRRRVRTEPGGRRDAAEVGVVVESVGRQQGAADARVVQLLMLLLHVTAASALVPGTVSQ